MELDSNPLVPGVYDLMLPLLFGSLVSVAFYVWFLWSLSRLFPLLGVKGAWGWIPVWNQWQLIQRGGLPGWLVLLGLVPGLGGIVVVVVTLIAINRINVEFGKGGGMTVLGFFLVPLWAMLLANHIRDGRYGAAAAWAPANSAAGAGAGALQGLPYANVGPQANYAPQGQQVSAAPQPQPQPQRSVFAPPTNARAAVAHGEPGGAHVEPAPAERNEWGFSKTTEGAYERLAAEGPQAPMTAPLGGQVPQQPFSWPAPQVEETAPPAPAAPVAPPMHAVPPAPPATAGARTPAELSAPQSPAAPPAPPALAAVVAPPVAATPDTEVDDFDDDNTVVVRRKTRWGLELPDGEVLELHGYDVVVGRRPEPTGAYEVLKINDPTRTLSKSHVRMRRTGEVWTVEDLHSTNGVALITESGATEALEPGHERAATDRMLIGTLEVQLVRIS